MPAPLRLHAIFPRWEKLLEARPELAARLSAHEVGTLRMASLGLPTALGALPPEVAVSFCDDHVGDGAADLAPRPDAVLLGYFTAQATRAHAIADAWRARGVPVLAGGIHPSAAPDDALGHADAVVRGPVEGLWERILADLAAGRMRGVYSGAADAPFAAPRRSIFAGSRHLRLDVLQAARGCDRGCGFCVVPAAHGGRVVRRDPAATAADLAGLDHPCVFLADENPLWDGPADRAWSAAFHAAAHAAGVRKRLLAAAYPRTVIGFDDGRARAWHACGLRQIYLICGYRAPLCDELAEPRLAARMEALRRIGIEVLATFTLGHDRDPVRTAPAILDFWQRTGANLAEVTIAVPFPGTAWRAALAQAGRLRPDQPWSRHNGAWCVYQPVGQSAGDLEARYLDLWGRLYAGRSRFAVEQSYLKGFGRGILAGDGAAAPAS